jgi:uncharacterized protein (DUF1330 family)
MLASCAKTTARAEFLLGNARFARWMASGWDCVARNHGMAQSDRPSRSSQRLCSDASIGHLNRLYLAASEHRSNSRLRIAKFRRQRQGKEVKSKPGYLLVMGTALDRDAMNRYQERIPPIYESYGGYRLIMGEPPGDATFLAGSLNNPGVMLARFPSLDHVSEFWWSEDYRKAYLLRKDAGRFAAVGLPGLDREPDPLPGSRSYLVAMAAPDSPGPWRHFADALAAGLHGLGATILADAGPEAIERLENSMPGSHVLVAVMPRGQDAKSAWAALGPELEGLREAAEPVNIMALEGLPDDHPGRLT